MSRHPHVREYISSAVGLLLGGVAFLGTLVGFGWNPGRTATTLGFASNFFDIQGRAFLDGRLSVPTDSLGIEGFVIDGKTYMYFPPFPAIARLPILLTTDEFDGQLTVLMMAVAWMIFAVMSARLVWLVRAVMGRTRTPKLRECIGAAALITAMTGGTVLTYDAALPWVYHEVYTWAAAFFMTAAYWMIRFALRPSRHAAVWIGAATLGAVMTRTTGGFALAIVCVGYGGYLWWRGGRHSRPAARALMQAGSLPVAASVVLNQIKFGHPYLFPLENQVFSTVNEHRRMALEANGGTITGLQFIPSTALAYLRPDGIRFTEYFPWVTLPAHPASAVGGAVLDQTYRTGSVPAFMPLLTLLTVVAVLFVPRLVRSRPSRSVLLPFAAGVLLIGPVLMYGYITHRYTSEFVPLLVVGGAIGYWGLATIRTRHTLITQRALSGGVVVGALVSVLFQLLTAHQAAVFGERGQALERYVARQLELPGSVALSSHILSGNQLPEHGRTDSLFIQGDCEALFVNSGDTYEGWVLVQQRPLVVGLSLDEKYRPGLVPLFAVDGPQRREVALEVAENRRARVVITAEDGSAKGPWFTMYEGSEVRLGLGVQSELGYAEITSTPGGHVAFVPWATYDPDTWVVEPGEITTLETSSLAERRGLSVRDHSGLSLPLCKKAQQAAGQTR